MTSSLTHQATLTQTVNVDMACRVTSERALNVAKNWGVGLLYGAYSRVEYDFELILTVKIKIRHFVEGSSGSEFPMIGNHRVVMAA